MENNRSYRIRTKISKENDVIKVDLPLVQTYDMFEILSLKLNQKNEYSFYDSDYGVIVGRVVANDNFGIPNAKVSVFIPIDEDSTVNQRILYNFVSPQDTNYDNIRYNLLPDFLDNACHQDVGTFPNKRLVLDNNDVIEIFEKYYKYTTVTNESGDYMIFGVPTGSQNIHVDLDMSDIGVLSQRPRDMVYKGYNINQFESPNKFKSSNNLNSLVQLYSQDKGVFVYSYWGNSNNGDEHIAITRCDINIEYKFEPTCVFIGSIITDKGSNAIGKNCTGTDQVGKMADLSAGEGSIEMIRKTIDGKVEEFPIKGNRLINGDGIWCYQIPMNLDYVMTDEFGNIVPTDDPSKGIPTRTRARFRISLEESPTDATAHKRCCFLVPNNPHYDNEYPQFMKAKEADYEFGSATNEESYCDLFWNNVYTVKSYIPRLQKNKNSTNRKHTGIKLINHYGDNNPMPYNNLSIKLSFTYRFICVLMKIVIWIIATINTVLALIMEPLCQIANLFLKISKGLCFKILGIRPLCWLGKPFELLGKLFMSMVVKGITLSSSFCDDGINKIAFYPILMKIAPCVLKKVKDSHNKEQNGIKNPEERSRLEVIQISNMNNNVLITCIENQLAQENDATSFNFQNDWVNGVLYAPLWYRKITPKKSFLFGLFKRKAKDQWCRADTNFNLMVYQQCALKRNLTGETFNSPITGKPYNTPSSINNNCGSKCHNEKTTVNVNKGLILTKENLLGQTIYYYRALNYDYELAKRRNGDGVILLFATDIVLLGSLNDCDSNGIPQFFKNLVSTTYKLPTDILFTDTVIEVDSEGNVVINGNNDIIYEQFTEATGCDWGNLNKFDECGEMGKHSDGGLFYGIGCSSIEMERKSCLNLSRICEYGVSLDEAKEVADLTKLEGDEGAYDKLTPDGFISYDELYNVDERSMFATLNGNRLRTRLNNKNGLKEYDLRYLYTNNFDGLLKGLMRKSGDCNYSKNHNLETCSRDYYMFRMGSDPYYYDNNNSLPRYENSFYFYFGLKMGKTAIDKFNSEFFSPCENDSSVASPFTIDYKPNSWCSDMHNNGDGYILLDMTNVSKNYDIMINSLENNSIGFSILNIPYDKISLGKVPDDIKGYHDMSDKTFIPNGKYEITIIDADGNISSTDISFMPLKVYFTFSKVDNEIPNNQRFDENESYQDIIDKATENLDMYGGYIIIDSIIDEENANGQYKLMISPYREDDFNDYEVKYEGYAQEISIKDYEIQKFVKNNCFIYDEETKTIRIVVPKGDVDYKLSITAMCDGKENNKNSSQVIIRINDTLPYKLFVNEVDISGLKMEIFGIGWKDNINNFNPDIDNIGKAWIHLSNRSNYDITKVDGYDEVKEQYDNMKENVVDTYNSLSQICNKYAEFVGNINNEINGFLESISNDEHYQNITKDEEIEKIKQDYKNMFSEIHEDNTEEQKMLEQQIFEIIDDYIQIKSDFINDTSIKDFENNYIDLVKETFWLTSLLEPKDITITVQTRKLPVKYHLYYNEEENNGENDANQLTKEDGNKYKSNNPDFEMYSIDDIQIPTIASVTNEDYGYDGSVANVKSGNICFGYDRLNGVNEKGEYVRDQNKWFKKPYGIRVVNSSGQKLPVIGNMSVKMEGDDNNELYFFFHIIDKVLRLNNMVAWSYVNNIPYYGRDDKRGQFVKMNGLFTGVINNGILDNNNPQFPTFELGNISNIQVKTINGEDDIPTIRYIDNKDGKTYIGYNKDNKSDYIEVGRSQDELTIEDNKNAYISETIYGDMSVSLNRLVDKVLTMSLNKGDNDDNNRFYLIEYNGSNYPLAGSTLNVNNGIWTKTFNGNSDLYDKNININTLYGKVTNKADGHTPTEENENAIDRNHGYSTNGVFDIDNDLKRFFVIVVTSNNCRTVSPLYDRSEDVQINLILSELNTITGNANSGYNNVVDYKLGVELSGNLPYYVDYFTSNLDFSLKLNEQLKVEGNGTFSPISIGTPLDNKIIYFNLDTTMYTQLKNYFDNDSIFAKLIFNSSVRKKTNCIITDVTNLPLKADVNELSGNGSRSETRYAVVWNVNNIKDEIDENTDLTIHKKGNEWVDSIFNSGYPTNVEVKNGYYYGGLVKIGLDGNPIHIDRFPFQMNNESIIIEAIYEPTIFKLALGANGKWKDTLTTEMREASFNADTNTITPDDIEIDEGYEFDGWSSSVGDDLIEITNNEISNIGVMYKDNVTNIREVTFTANFKQIQNG